MRTKGFLINNYKRTVNLKVLGLFAILLLFSWSVSDLIVYSSTSMVIAAIVAIILFVVIFFYPRVGLMLILFVIPFEEIVSYPIFKIIALVFMISWLARKSITKEQIHFSFKYPQTKYLIGLIFALILSLFFSIDKPDSLIFFQRFILLIALYVFLIDSIQSPKDLRNLGWVIGFSGGLASLVGLMQYYVFHTGILKTSQSLGLIEKYDTTTAKGIRIGGFTGNPDHFAMYLVVSICFLFYCFLKTRNLIIRILIMILIGCSTASVVFTLSRAGILTLGLVVVIFGIRFKRYKLTAILSLLLMGLALVLILKSNFAYDRLVNLTFHRKDLSSENRAKIMESSIYMLLEHPNILITGVGLDNFPKVAWNHRDAHNMFLQMLTETGLIGFTFFFLLIYRSYRDIWHGIKLKQVELQLFYLAAFAAFSAILVGGLFTTFTYIKYLWMFFALVPILYNIRRKNYAPT